RVHPLRRVEVADLASGLRLVARDVELRDLAEAGPAFDEVAPRGLHVVADRADHAEAGDDDAAVVIGFAHARRASFLRGRVVEVGGQAGTRVAGGTGSRPGAAGSSRASASAPGAMRLIRPVRTRPVPTSRNRVTPAAAIRSTAAT